MPGTVAPGELERIAEHLGQPCDMTFVSQYFDASDGPLVGKMANGELQQYQIPTIVPRLTETGCVFLKDGRCQIHPVAPFGCAYHRVCVTEPDADDKSAYVLNLIMRSHVVGGRYSLIMRALSACNLTATPLATRKESFARALIEPIADSLKEIGRSLAEAGKPRSEDEPHDAV
jgi:hypothetical protein